MITLRIKSPPKYESTEEEEESLPEPPKYLHSQKFAENEEVYTKNFKIKDIKRIYKRIINP
jgi:hypothetical protein